MSNTDSHSNIQFFSEDTPFQLDQSDKIVQWIKSSIATEGKEVDTITYIFCSDDYLLQLNKTHLNHDTLTDIISFPYGVASISGDIFISIDRVRDNAAKYSVDFSEELHRVMIHGVLHFCGYADKTDQEKDTMRSKENYYLSLI